MDNRTAVLSLFTLVVISSGCIGPFTGDGFEGSVQVTEHAITPSQIYEGQEVNINLEARNTGPREAKIRLGEKGSNVLKDYCTDIFKLEEDSFTAISTADTDTKEEEPYTLEHGHIVRMSWRLQQEGNVPIYGHECPVRMELPFNYSVTAFRQIQLKRDREVSGSQNLQFKSSSGPLDITIDTVPGRTGQSYTYLADEDEGSVEVLLQMVNNKPDESYKKGLVDIEEESLKVEATSPLQLDEQMNSEGDWEVASGAGYSDTRCDDVGGNIDQGISVFEGESVVIRCDVPVPTDMDQPGEISEISADVDYTFVKDLSTRTIEVQSRGG